jgi:hypothetical protein
MTTGEKALREVAELITTSRQQRERLVKAGWERVLSPPLVGNQWIWKHPLWYVQLESEALRIIEAE